MYSQSSLFGASHSFCSSALAIYMEVVSCHKPTDEHEMGVTGTNESVYVHVSVGVDYPHIV